MGECIECLGGCNVCSSGSFTTCLGCAEGYYLKDGSCTPCDEKCTVCSSATSCSACATGYKLDGTSCISSCVFPCSTCSKTNPNSCLSCYGGYDLSGSKCNSNTNCNDDSSCEFCPREFYLLDGNCNACNIDQCINCENDGTKTSCTRCATGYTV